MDRNHIIGHKKSIVILCTDSHGDLLLRQPMFSALLDAGHDVHVVVRKGHETLLPFLDERLSGIVTQIYPELPPDESSGHQVEILRQNISCLRPEVLVSARYNRTWLDDWLMHLFPDVERVGFENGSLGDEILKSLAALGEAQRSTAGNTFTHTLSCDADVHEAVKNQILLHALAGVKLEPYDPALCLPHGLHEKAVGLLQGLGLEPRHFVLGTPAGTVNVPMKIWPAESFVDLAVHLERKHHQRLLVTGLRCEADFLEKIIRLGASKGVQISSWIGMGEDLDLLLGLVAMSRLYLGVDTATMHFAGALGVPVAALFGGGHWPRFLPLASRSFVAVQALPCFGCNWKCWLDKPLCMEMVEVKKVREGLDWVLSESKAEQRRDLGQPLDRWVHFIAQTQRERVNRNFELERLLRESESDRAARMQLINERGGEILALQEQVRNIESESRLRLELINERGGEILALQEQVRNIESESRLRLEMLEQYGGEILALKEQIERIHGDGFQWLLSTNVRSPRHFEFLHAVEANMVSVIIPAYNAERFLDRSVRSVWEQQLQGWAVEIILCDDGSKDGTFEKALALQSRSQMPMHVLSHPGKVNKGVSATRNAAMREARGAFIALLDADDVWLPNRLTRQLDFFSQHPETRCVCSLGYNRDLDGNLVRGWNGTCIAGDYSRVPPPEDFHPPYTFEEMIKGDPVVNSTLLIRREAVERAGGYPELMAHQAEDWLLLAKLSLESPIMLLEEKLIDYTVHSESYTNQYVQQGFAYGVQIEFIYHLVHWMVQHPEHREMGERLFRRYYPRLIATHSNAYRLMEEYYDKHQQTTQGVVEFEAHLAGIYDELRRYRSRYGYVDRLMGPLWSTPVPGLILHIFRSIGSLVRGIPKLRGRERV